MFTVLAALAITALVGKVVSDVYDPSLSDSDRALRRERNLGGVL